jgi:hypothetical protein
MRLLLGRMADQLPTLTLLFAPFAGIAQPGHILAASAVACGVFGLWLVLRWPIAPVPLGLNLHLALVPWMFVALGYLGAEALQDRIEPLVLPSVTAAGAMSALIAVLRRPRARPGAVPALAALCLGAVAWAAAFTPDRFLAVGVPSLGLALAVARCAPARG